MCIVIWTCHLVAQILIVTNLHSSQIIELSERMCLIGLTHTTVYTQMSIKCGRKCGHCTATVITETATVMKIKVFRCLGQPCAHADTLTVPVVIGMEGILCQPVIPLGLVHASGIVTDVTHKDSFEAGEVSCYRLTNLDNSIFIGQVFGCPLHNGICIVLILFVAISVVKHTGGSHGSALIICTGPFVAHLVILRIIRVEDMAVEFSTLQVVQLCPMSGISILGLLIILVITSGHSQITGSHTGRTVHTTVRSRLAHTPDECVVTIGIGTLVHLVKVGFGYRPVFFLSSQKIGSCTGNAHPGYIVIIIVSAPVCSVSLAEILVQFVKHGGILYVTCGFIGIQYDFEHFGIAPPATFSNNVTHRSLVVITGLPSLHHFRAHFGSQLVRFGLNNLHLPSDTFRVSALFALQSELLTQFLVGW